MRVCPKCRKQVPGAGKICRACGAILKEVPDDQAADWLDQTAEAGASRPRDSLPRLAPTPQSSAARGALGLPNGSIRALLTLLIVAVVVVQVAGGQDVELLWTETLMIALAHYFTSRRLVKLPPEVLSRLAAEGHVEAEARPLYLPKHSIRALVILAFVGLAVYLYQHDQLFRANALPILGVVAAYLLGTVIRFRGVRGWEDLKAAVVLVVLLCTAGAHLLGKADLVPTWLENATLALVLFYFGSR